MSVHRYRNHNLDSHNAGITLLEGQFTVDSTQTTDTTQYKVHAGSIQGTGIYKVSNQATGVYKVTLTDKYFKMLSFDYSVAGTLGTPVAIASASNGVPYVISTIGTSAQADFVLAGMDTNITAAVGVAFTAGSGASGSTGTGYVAPIITSNVTRIQVYGDPNTTLNPKPNGSPYFYIQTLQASTDVLTAAAPTDLTVIRFKIILRNSNLKGTGE